MNGESIQHDEEFRKRESSTASVFSVIEEWGEHDKLISNMLSLRDL